MNRFCFIHVPKCGGMTFRQIVASRCAKDDVLPARTNEELYRMSAKQIAGYKAVAGHFDYGIFDVLPPEFLKFTVLRDPVKRYVSTVSHMMRDPAFSEFHAELSGLSLNEALLRPSVTRAMRNSVVKLFCKDPIPTGVGSAEEARQTEKKRYAVNADISLALERLRGFNVVGTQEHYLESVQLMLMAAGLPPIKESLKVNDDTTGRQDEVSRDVLAAVRELVDLDLVLYRYASRRLRDDVSRALYMLAAERHASHEPFVPDRFKFDLARLPGSYGWYAPEINSSGLAQLWSGSRNEQGFVLKIKPRSKYVLLLGLHAREKGREIRIRTNLPRSVVKFMPFGAAVLVDNRGDNELLDVTLVYRDARSPKESGSGEDLRKLGVLLFGLGIVKVDSLEIADFGAYVKAVSSSPPGELKL